ncbi:MAG: hypothetical protein AAF581_18885 [Planctomycetota bacterium]
MSTSTLALPVGSCTVHFHPATPAARNALVRRYDQHLIATASQASIHLIHEPRGATSPDSVDDRYGFQTSLAGDRLEMHSAVANAAIDLGQGSGTIQMDFGERAADYYLENILRQLFQLVAIRQQAFLVHAAGIRASNETGQIFAGQSGAGKSTISKILAVLGYDVLSDDLVLIEAGGTTPRLCSTPFYGTYRPSTTVPRSTDLDAINFLQQAPHPSAQEISDVAVGTALLLTNIPFADSIDTRHRKELIDVTSRLIASVTARRLAFRPDTSFLRFTGLPVTGWQTKTSTPLRKETA